MSGVDRYTGKVLSGWPHVTQSIMVLFTTRFGERIMREYFGSLVPDLLGKNLTQESILRFFWTMVVAIELWEPRFKVTSVDLIDSDHIEEGKLGFCLNGNYCPRGHLGDFRVENKQSLSVIKDSKGNWRPQI